MLTIEAKLLALSTIAKEIIAIYKLFSQIKFNPGTQLLIIECNNLQTVELIIKEYPELTTKLYYIDIHHF
jgi:hypothetical protein